MDVFFNLTLNGLATGMLIFLLAAGLTLIFGLMNVLNFAHGGLFAWGAYTGVWVYIQTGSFIVSIICAVIVGIILGGLMERWIVRPVYGNHVQQILITLGVMLVLSEMLKVVWGPNQLSAKSPELLSGSWQIGEIIIIKYRLLVILLGICVFVAAQLLLTRTKLGLIVRAGVSDPKWCKHWASISGVSLLGVLPYWDCIGCTRWGIVRALRGRNPCGYGNGVCDSRLYCCGDRWYGQYPRFRIGSSNCRAGRSVYELLCARFILGS